MGPFLLRRLAMLPVMWLAITVLAFSIGSLAPGDPATVQLERRTAGRSPSAEEIAALRQQMHLDDPLLVRYTYWAVSAVRGDFGLSLTTGEPALQALALRFPATLELAVVATLLAILVGVPLGIVAAVKRNAIVDHFSRVVALVGASIPGFWLSYVLILVFGVSLHLLPIGGSGGVDHLVMPSVALAIGMMAVVTRLTRSSMLEVLGEDFLRTARGKGLSERQVVIRHALRNAQIPLVTLFGLEFASLLGGALVVENVFGWPGIGLLVVQAIGNRDYPLVQAFVLFTGTVFLFMSLLVDFTYVLLDPRIRRRDR